MRQRSTSPRAGAWLLALGLGLAGGGSAGTSAAPGEPAGWTTYRNEHYGFAFAYPASVFAPVPPRAGDGLSDRASERSGQAFASRDGSAFITAAAAPNATGDGPRAYRARAIANSYAKARITFERMESDGFVVSGFKGRDIFYERVVFSCGGRVVNAWVATYPAAQRARYDPIVEALAGNFRPGARGGCR